VFRSVEPRINYAVEIDGIRNKGHMDIFFVTNEQLVEALAKLPPDMVIGRADRAIRVSDVAQLCTFPLPDGESVPVRLITIYRQAERGCFVEIWPEALPSGEWRGFDVEPGSAALPVLQTLKQHDGPDPSRGSPRFELKDGKYVYLRKLVIGNTYEGCLEGDRRVFSTQILERAPQQARDLIKTGTSMPMVVVPPEYLPLPNLMWVAELERHEDSRVDGPMVSSTLCLAWFEETLGRPVDDVIRVAVARVDWYAHAFTYEWEP
jgi:hypothetical protein